jgi:hypothetical protein
MSMFDTQRLVGALSRNAGIVVLVVSALIPELAYADNVNPPTVPSDIRVPAGNVPFLVGHATGTQNYTCQQTSPGFGWRLVAPSATLVDDKGKQIATHYAGPTWQAKDGSSVKGTRVGFVTVSTSAIDWLLLKATAPTIGANGGDRLSATSYIQRVNTTGGLAPTAFCSGANLGDALNVPYTADYYFYKAQ